jgi:hypothetical protein
LVGPRILSLSNERGKGASVIRSAKEDWLGQRKRLAANEFGLTKEKSFIQPFGLWCFLHSLGEGFFVASSGKIAKLQKNNDPPSLEIPGSRLQWAQKSSILEVEKMSFRAGHFYLLRGIEDEKVQRM